MSSYFLPRLNLDTKQHGADSAETLPVYSPPSPARRKRPTSLSSSLAGSILNIEMEKAEPSPSSTSATLAEFGSPTSSDMSPQELEYVELRDSYAHASPAISIPPPTLQRQRSVAELESTLPSFHRPFTPPTVYPMSASEALAQCSSIRMTIHTESSELI